MPHIKRNCTEADWAKSICFELDRLPIKTKGDLEFILARVCKAYMDDKEVKYTNLHDVVYACHHVGDEFRRLYLDKREDEAIKENGNAFET